MDAIAKKKHTDLVFRKIRASVEGCDQEGGLDLLESGLDGYVVGQVALDEFGALSGQRFGFL